MGILKGVRFPKPGSFGVTTQDDIASTEILKQFSSVATNHVIDSTGKLTAREDFVLQTTGFADTLDVAYTHRANDGTETVMSAGSGVVYSGISTLTSRFDYRQGSQIVDVGGAKTGATATGLANSAEVYGFTVSIDGGASQQISVTGSAAQTYTNLLAEINTDLTGATCVLVGGNIKIISDTVGAGSSVSISTGAGTASNAMLAAVLTGFVAVRTASAGTTTNDHWQFASLSSKIFMAQKAQAFTCLNESTFAVESIVGQPRTSSPNVVIAADGRLWAADDETGGERHTVWWSNLLDGKTWNSGDAGELDVRNVWPSGQDSIVALAFMSGRLLILGRNSLLLYTLPATHDPGDMELTDVIAGIGCKARDSVVISGGDVYFLSDDGVYKIPKLAQTISLLPVPVKISKYMADDVVTTYASETLTAVRGGYFPKEKWYVLNAPVANKIYCFHLNHMVPGGENAPEVPAITTWTNAGNVFRGFAFDKDGNWYAAMDKGLGKYTGYTPNSSTSNAYSVDWMTLWEDFEDESRVKSLKNFAMTLEAASGQTGTFKWLTDYKESSGTTNTVTFTCDSSEFAENPGLGTVSKPIGRTCNVAKFGYTAAITGNKVTTHALRVFATPGGTRIR
jgi:hypothetical protein